MTDHDKQTLINALFRIADYARIAHHIPGRIRIKMALAAKKALADLDLDNITTDLPGIRYHRLNSKNGSVVIEYDPTIIDPKLWERLITLPEPQRPTMREELLNLWHQTPS